MSASKDDYFQKVGRSTATTLSSPGYTIGDTSINVASTTNWPTDTGVTFAIDVVGSDGLRVSGSYNVFRGVVSSATQVSSVTYVGGDANRDYTSGATTRVYILVSAYRDNRFTDGLLVEHKNTGAHAAVTADSLVTTGDITVGGDIKISNGNSINDDSDNELVKFAKTSSAVNELTVTNAATGNAPQIAASGGDSNVDLLLKAKGTGTIKLNGASEGQIATVATSETTTSTSYADLATTTDTVTFTVPSNGKVKVVISGLFSNNGAQQTYISVALSGGNTLAANDTNALIQGAIATNFQMSRTVILTGLTAGSTTFKLKYRVTGGTGTFANRSIVVEPFL